MKDLIRKITMKVIAFKSSIKIDFKSNVSKRGLIAFYKHIGNKKYPVKIINSQIDNLRMSEGCKIVNSICSGKIELGRFVSINGPGTRISSRIDGIKIGSFTSIASNVIIQEDYHDYKRPTSYFINQNILKGSVNKDIFTKGKIIVEEDVWIGSNSVILSGVNIGRGAIIGAGSVVTKNIPRYAIVAGNPAKILKYRFDDEVIERLENSQWWNWSTEEILQNKDFFEEIKSTKDVKLSLS